MKKLMMGLLVLLVAACSVEHYNGLDTTSNLTKPSEGKAGIYVYRMKTGIVDSAYYVNFEIRGLPEIALRANEYTYFELQPGTYQYKYQQGDGKEFRKVKLESGMNYFFYASRMKNEDWYGGDSIVLVLSQKAMDAAKRNINAGRFKLTTNPIHN